MLEAYSLHGARPSVLPLAPETELAISARGEHEGAGAEEVGLRTEVGKGEEEGEERKGIKCSLWREDTSRYGGYLCVLNHYISCITVISDLDDDVSQM